MPESKAAAPGTETASELQAPSMTLWPTPLVVGMAILLLALLALMHMELPIYAHDPRMRLWQPLVSLLSSFLPVIVWLIAEVRSKRYLQPSVERPLYWFLCHLRRLPLLIVAFIVATYGLRYAAFTVLGAAFRPMWQIVIVYESLKVILVYSCWLALVFGLLTFAQMRQQAERLLNVQKTLMEAKLIQLKAQLRPHFLFNTLNTISAFMQVDVARADRLLTQLGDLLRANLTVSERNLTELEEEVRLLRQYAQIMQERFIGRVTVEWAVAEDTLRAAVPAMLLQPLLENAFKHGVERSTAPEHVRVRTARDGNDLHVSIRNTGSVLANDYQEGWGLRNCRERLHLLYGAAASLSLRKDAEGAVVAQVILPWSETANDARADR